MHGSLHRTECRDIPGKRFPSGASYCWRLPILRKASQSHRQVVWVHNGCLRFRVSADGRFSTVHSLFVEKSAPAEPECESVLRPWILPRMYWNRKAVWLLGVVLFWSRRLSSGLWVCRFSHQCRTFFGRGAGNGCDLSSGRFYLASKDFLTGAGNSFFGGIHALGKLLSPFYKAVIDTVSSAIRRRVHRLSIDWPFWPGGFFRVLF